VIHAEELCFNPLTGRKVWLLRNIPKGDFGDRWDASLVVMRESWWTWNKAKIQGGEKITRPSVYRAIHRMLAKLGFSDAWAMRNGKIKTYKVKTRGLRDDRL